MESLHILLQFSCNFELNFEFQSATVTAKRDTTFTTENIKLHPQMSRVKNHADGKITIIKNHSEFLPLGLSPFSISC